jgi:RHS repeat-associated protein
MSKENGGTPTSETHWYRRNARGDVTHILDAGGAVEAEYAYDAWGNHAVLGPDGAGGWVENEDPGFVGNVNPLRYRSYYFDIETGLYYLKSRYYDPQTGRFVSADAIDQLDPERINGLNLYAYCGSNPVMRVDPAGSFFFPNPFDVLGALLSPAVGLVGVAVDAFAGAVSVALNAAADAVGGAVNWLVTDPVGQVVLGTLIIAGLFAASVLTGGAASPLLLAASHALMGVAISASANAIVGAAFGYLNGDLEGAAEGFMWGAITGAVAGAASAGLGAVSIGSKVLVAMGGNALISGGVTAAYGLATDSFSWADVGISMLFGGIGGRLGMKNTRHIRELAVGLGLGFAEGGIGFAIASGALRSPGRQKEGSHPLLEKARPALERLRKRMERLRQYGSPARMGW